MENRKQYIIAYDVSDSKIRTRIKKSCERYGYRIQFSVFSCDLNPKQYRKLLKELAEIIKQAEDNQTIKSIIIFPQCKECEAGSKIIGDDVKICYNERSIII